MPSRPRHLAIVCHLTVSTALLTGVAASEAPANARATYQVTGAVTPITIDGVLDEDAWRHAVRIEVNTEVEPAENLPAPVTAECYVTFDQRALYIGCRCTDPQPAQIRADLTDRDGAWRNDYIGVILDTFADQRRAYQFFVNPLGVQGDSLRNEVGSDDNEDSNWDAIWDSAGRITAQGYEVEMAIPFRAA